MDAALLELDGQDILQRAELLLFDVNCAVVKNVPEVFDEDQTVDDEAVLAILKEGGPPPNQLALPCLYQSRQRTLEQLSVCDTIRIELTQLLVLSKLYRVRKEGSFLVIHPPAGCPRHAKEPQSIRLPLYELQDKVSHMLPKNSKDNSDRNYFQGHVDLVRSVDLKLEITNEVMQEWQNRSPGGCIRIELYGYVNPPVAVIRGELCSPDRFAHAIIPLDKMFCPGLDLVLQTDLVMDLATKSLIVHRNMTHTTGTGFKSSPALGSKLGTVSVRVSLVNTGGTAQPLPFSPQATACCESKDSATHGALDFVPEEPRRRDQLKPLTAGEVWQASERKEQPNVYAMALCALEDFRVPVEILLDIEHKATRSPVLSIAYKHSSR
jgi:hypothetical protein